MDTTLYTLQGQEKGKITLPALFEAKVSPKLLHEVVTGYLANQRFGNHSTKTRADVSGSGRKLYKQKGTGNARAGSIRSPLRRHGGIIFGPKPHGYYQNVPRQKRQLSLTMALTEKVKNGSMKVIENITLAEPKTKQMAGILKNLKLNSGTVLLVVEKADDRLKKASRNIRDLVIAEAANINTYQVMWAATLVITSGAIDQLQKKIEAAAK